MPELWARMSSCSYANRGKWDLEFEITFALGCFTGIRVGVGMSGADTSNDIAAGADPVTSPNFANLDYVVRRIAAAGYKVLLGLGGDGPPMTTFWQGKNGGTTWLDVKRPPLGTSDVFLIASRAVKQKIIDRVDEIYRSYGLNPADYVFLDLWNEPAIGGAGAPPDGTFYTNAGMTYSTSIGKWDASADYSGFATNEGAPFIEFFTRELEGLDFKGMTCVSPTFTAISISTELSTFDVAATNGKKWIDVCRTNPGFSNLIFGINCYYNAFSLGTTGIEPEFYVEANLGPVEYAEMAVYGNDYRGADSGDGQCIARKIALLRANARIARNKIAIVEAGVQPTYMGMKDSSTPSVGSMSFNYSVNLQTVGQAQLEFLDLLLEQDIVFVGHFTITNVSTAFTQFYGFLRSEADISPIPNAPDQRQTAVYVAWARRFGLPLTALVSGDYGVFFGTDIKKGDSEVLP